MTRRRRRFLIVIALAAGVIVAVAAGARAIAPGWLRGTIERAASQAIGRELKIAGAFDLSISRTPTVAASDITLANAPWGSEPLMVRAGHVKLSVDLLSLWFMILLYRKLAIFTKITRPQNPFQQLGIFFERFLMKCVTGTETLFNLPFHCFNLRRLCRGSGREETGCL